MKLNPRMLLKDYQSLAGRLKYTYEFIRNFARERDPTLALLQHWWSSSRGKEKTVTVLIEHLSDMQRDDCVDLLRPYEFSSKYRLCSNLYCVLNTQCTVSVMERTIHLCIDIYTWYFNVISCINHLTTITAGLYSK